MVTAGEYNIISGRINDLAWDGDSQRIIAVGDGKQRFGHCFTADSGNSVGEISGHSGPVNSVSIRQQRPLRAATGSDDSTTVFYHGAPFKFNTSLRGQHSNFINGIAFSPDGGTLASVGADKKVWLYDGKSGEPKAQLGAGEHKGSIFAVSWASDSKKFVTASADQTVKVWDAEAGKVLQTWSIGENASPSISHQQVGVVWPSGRQDGLLICLGLGGDLTYLVDGSQRPARVIHGHQKNITAAGVSHGSPEQGETFWTGSYDGRVCHWDLGTGSATVVDGECHTNQVVGFAELSNSEERLYSAGWDDSLRLIDGLTKKFTDKIAKLTSQPIAIARLNETTFTLITAASLQIYDKKAEKICETQLNTTLNSLAAGTNHQGVASVAVGGEDHVVRVFTVQSGWSSLKLESEMSDSTAPITALAFSPNKEYLAAGNSSGKILVYDTRSFKLAVDRWSAHTARVTSIAWNQESNHAVSGGLDTNLFLWSVKSPGKRIKIATAHKDGVNCVVWTAERNRIISVGADAAVKVWRAQLS